MKPESDERRGSLKAEDKIHVGLLVAVAALACAVIVGRSPSDGARPSSSPTVTSSPPSEVNRGELERAVAELKAWVEGSRGHARTPLDLSLALQGLGQAGLEPTQRSRELELLLAKRADLGGRSPARPASTVAGADAERAGRFAEDDAVPVLAILLEGGVPLDQELALPTGVVVVKRRVEDALRALGATRDPSPWELELLSLATLGGLGEYRERLAHVAQATLTRLDRRNRNSAARAGSGASTPATLDALAEQWRAEAPPRARASDDLHSSVATFRAVAVLAEPELEVQALRHLHTLLLRCQADHALYQHLLATSIEPAERVGIHVEALESFGRLGQALYGAHLAFRRKDRPDPDARTATAMRQAARGAMHHHRALAQAGVWAAAPEPGEHGALLRAAVHALRGLRTARVAIAQH